MQTRISVVTISILISLALYTRYTQAADSLTFHIIPHSHCDPGWLNTFEGYYSSEVHTILDGVLNALISASHRKFVWSETSFFAKWYEQLDDVHRAQMKEIVDNGQWEFINGGWAQHDEACPSPLAMINQMTEGIAYIRQNFGVVPSIAWQIDPFGHSAVSPAVFAQLGFGALVINRIHAQIKDKLKQTQQMEFLWKRADNGSALLTHVLHTHYSAPQGFDWEEGARQVDSNSVASRANELIATLRQRANAYIHGHLLVPFGDDFKFRNANNQFHNMDQLIEYINRNSVELGNIHIQYSTVSEYFQAIKNNNNNNKVSNKFPELTGDFFPYADNEDSYWTGYFTTRPNIKN